MPAVQETRSTLDTTILLSSLHALKKGNFSVRLPLDWTGVAGKVADTFNDVVELNERMAKELERLRQVVGREGKIAERASLGEVSGSWGAAIAFDGATADRTDGLKLSWPEREEWIQLRKSGTEPILRVIAEAPDPERAEALIERARELTPG